MKIMQMIYSYIHTALPSSHNSEYTTCSSLLPLLQVPRIQTAYDCHKFSIAAPTDASSSYRQTVLGLDLCILGFSGASLFL